MELAIQVLNSKPDLLNINPSPTVAESTKKLIMFGEAILGYIYDDEQ